MIFYPSLLRRIALVSALALTATQAVAQDGAPPEGGWTLGLFGFSSNTPYGFRDNAAAPMIEYENEYFKFGLPSTEIKLPWVSNEQLSFGVMIDLFGSESGYKASDAPILRGMAERDSGVWAGARMDWKTEVVDLSLKALRDVGGDSKGTSVEAEVSKTFFLNERLMVSPKIGAVWLNDNTVDYYYGVRSGEATATRAAYKGTSTVNMKVGVNVGYMIAQNQMLMMDLSVTKLGDEIADSPIVVDDTLTSVGLGYMFKF